jgi:hypothetical protein
MSCTKVTNRTPAAKTERILTKKNMSTLYRKRNLLKSGAVQGKVMSPAAALDGGNGKGVA